MINEELRIVYFGSDEFSEHILNNFKPWVDHQSMMSLVGVVTLPDKTTKVRGGTVIKTSPLSYSHDKVLKPKSFDNEFIRELNELNPNLFIVISYKILPKEVWCIPKYGTVNIHPSLLPRHRGAAPIEWTIMSGDQETGVTSFFIDDSLDQGRIICQSQLRDQYTKKVIDIRNMDAVGLSIKLITLCLSVLRDTVRQILSKGTEVETKDPESYIVSSYAKKLTSDITRIDWSKSATEIMNKIRGLYYGSKTSNNVSIVLGRAWTTLGGKRIGGIMADGPIDISQSSNGEDVGTIMYDSINGVIVVIEKNKYAMVLLTVQPEGKKVMNAIDWWNGIQNKNTLLLKFT